MITHDYLRNSQQDPSLYTVCVRVYLGWGVGLDEQPFQGNMAMPYVTQGSMTIRTLVGESGLMSERTPCS